MQAVNVCADDASFNTEPMCTVYSLVCSELYIDIFPKSSILIIECNCMSVYNFNNFNEFVLPISIYRISIHSLSLNLCAVMLEKLFRSWEYQYHTAKMHENIEFIPVSALIFIILLDW